MPNPRTSTPLAILLIVMTLLGWSAVPLFLKHFSHTIDPWTSNGWRYGFSALLWAPVLILGVVPTGLWRAAVIPSIFNTLGQICFTWAHYKIDPGLLTFGLRLQILFVALGAFMLFPAERRIIRTRTFILGAFTVFAGTIGTILLSPGNPAHADQHSPPASHALGVSLAVASGLFFACYALSVRHFMRGRNSIVAFAAISQFTAAVMVLLMLGLGVDFGLPAAQLPAPQIALLLLSALIGIALGHVFYYAAIARLGVAISSGVVQLQPILVTAFSTVLFNERMTALQITCGVIAIAGAAVMLSVQHRLSKQDAALAAAQPDNLLPAEAALAETQDDP
jgi:drug/metabolite transporter (DMT)-like permease